MKKQTLWPMEGTDFSYTLKVDETSTPEEIEAEVEYWMEQLILYDIKGEHRTTVLKAIQWMNSLGT